MKDKDPLFAKICIIIVFSGMSLVLIPVWVCISKELFALGFFYCDGFYKFILPMFIGTLMLVGAFEYMRYRIDK